MQDDASVSPDHPMYDRYRSCPVDHDVHLERRPVFSHIKELSICGTNISRNSIIQIAKHCPELIEFKATQRYIHDDAVEALVNNCLRLCTLFLPRTKLTDDERRAIAWF